MAAPAPFSSPIQGVTKKAEGVEALGGFKSLYDSEAASDNRLRKAVMMAKEAVQDATIKHTVYDASMKEGSASSSPIYNDGAFALSTVAPKAFATISFSGASGTFFLQSLLFQRHFFL